MQVRDWEARLAPSRFTRLRHRAMVGPWMHLAGRGPWSDARLRAYIARIRARRSGPTGWFGLKLHHHHHQRWTRGRPLDDLLGPVRWVRITRQDRLAQAVSWTRALQTGRWAAWQREGGVARYDRRAIGARLADLEAGEAAWDALLSGVPVLQVGFDEVVGDPQGTVQRVLRWLGELDDVVVSELPTPRQGDGLNAAWVERYLGG